MSTLLVLYIYIYIFLTEYLSRNYSLKVSSSDTDQIP